MSGELHVRLEAGIGTDLPSVQAEVKAVFIVSGGIPRADSYCSPRSRSCASRTSAFGWAVSAISNWGRSSILSTAF